MSQKAWIVALPALLLLGLGGRQLLIPPPRRAPDGRIMSSKGLALETELGYHLFAPTWLPRNGRLGVMEAVRGAKRVLQDFTDPDQRTLLIVAQERRTAERDRYHERLFIERADATTPIGSATGHFVTGSGGERRLFWQQGDMAIIISSQMLNDEELALVANRMR